MPVLNPALSPTTEFRVAFEFQPGANIWLAHCGGKEIRLLPAMLVERLVNEAIDKGLAVEAANRETHHLIKLNCPAAVAVLNTLAAI